MRNGHRDSTRIHSPGFRLVTVVRYKYTELAHQNYYSISGYQMRVQIPGGARKAILANAELRN